MAHRLLDASVLRESRCELCQRIAADLRAAIRCGALLDGGPDPDGERSRCAVTRCPSRPRTGPSPCSATGARSWPPAAAERGSGTSVTGTQTRVRVEPFVTGWDRSVTGSGHPSHRSQIPVRAGRRVPSPSHQRVTGVPAISRVQLDQGRAGCSRIDRCPTPFAVFGRAETHPVHFTPGFTSAGRSSARAHIGGMRI